MALPAQPPASKPSPPPSEPSPPSAAPFHGTHPARHYGALAVSVLAPLALALPPRRLDARNALMAMGLLWSANQLAHDYTGTALSERARRRMLKVFDAELPERARRNK